MRTPSVEEVNAAVDELLRANDRARSQIPVGLLGRLFISNEIRNMMDKPMGRLK